MHYSHIKTKKENKKKKKKVSENIESSDYQSLIKEKRLEEQEKNIYMYQRVWRFIIELFSQEVDYSSKFMSWV